MNAKRVHRKPIGEDGAVRCTNVGGPPKVSWQKIKYPPEKRDQEISIASAFVSALNIANSSTWELSPLTENDFDFEIISPGEKRYLELQEIVIPPKKRGSPYEDREQVIRSQRFAETILSEINKKRVKYPPVLDQQLDLLIYVTHWRFLPHGVVIKLVAAGLAGLKHPFSRVYFFQRMSEVAGHFELIIPYGELLKGFDPRKMKHHEYINFDPASAEPFSDGKQIGVRLNLSPKVVRKLQQ
jgi:hypothetical protein